MNFTQFDLHQGINSAIQEAGYTTPTPIQLQAIPEILRGSDLRASAQTGTGKTAAFILPTLHKLMTSPATNSSRGPRVLILVPTRELAMQVAAETTKYAKFLPRLKTVCIYGGIPYPVQHRDLARPYEILVATPGRLIDFLTRGKISLARVEMFILDEADRMLDMGFIEPVEHIADAIPKTRQTLMFSATLKGAVQKLSQRLLTNPVEICIEPEKATISNIEQRIHFVDNMTHKQDVLEHLLTDSSLSQAIVFIATKRHAEELVDKLLEIGHNAAALHGDMNQKQRTRTIRRLRLGEIRILVATDVAARGIDVQTISHVINFDLPMCAEDYVHRIGRTGRAGASGVALSLVSNRDIRLLKQIEQFTKQKITTHVIPGMEPKTKPNTNTSSRFDQRPRPASRHRFCHRREHTSRPSR